MGSQIGREESADRSLLLFIPTLLARFDAHHPTA